MSVVYVDTSAALKLVWREAESEAYLQYAQSQLSLGARLVSSQLLEVELARFAVRENLNHADTIAPIVEQHSRIAITADIVRRAVGIQHHVRSLDAIHLATALHLGSSLKAFVTYDRMLGTVAEKLGLPVVAPTT